MTTTTLTPSSDSEGESRKLTLAYFSNEFPHDDLHGLVRRIHIYSKDRRHPILARFLDEATLAIRDEIKQLPVELRILIPSFQTILNFVDYPELRKGPLSGSIDGILLCVVELASFIG
jgi:monodictyphenone polyketide synthase